MPRLPANGILALGVIDTRCANSIIYHALHALRAILYGASFAVVMMSTDLAHRPHPKQKARQRISGFDSSAESIFPYSSSSPDATIMHR
jgi:hypothetical protein